MSAKPGLPAGQGAQESPRGSLPLVSSPCCPSEGHRGHRDHCQALLTLTRKSRQAFMPKLEGEGESFSPPLVLSLPCSLLDIKLGFQLLYHLICFLIWSWAAMWLIKGRCELSSSQRSPYIQTSMLIHPAPCLQLPCSAPSCHFSVYSFTPNALSRNSHFLSPLFVWPLDSRLSLKISSFSSSHCQKLK